MHDEVAAAGRLTPHRVGEAILIRVQEALRELADAIRQRFEGQGESGILVERVSPTIDEPGCRGERIAKIAEPSIHAICGVHNLTASCSIAASCSGFRAAALTTDTGTPSSISISISN